MKNLIRKSTILLASFILLFLVMSAATFGQNGHDTNGNDTNGNIAVVAVPEPGTLAMLGAGLISIGLYAWKKRKRG
jgi:hypothetical protein